MVAKIGRAVKVLLTQRNHLFGCVQKYMCAHHFVHLALGPFEGKEYNF